MTQIWDETRPRIGPGVGCWGLEGDEREVMIMHQKVGGRDDAGETRRVCGPENGDEHGANERCMAYGVSFSLSSTSFRRDEEQPGWKEKAVAFRM